METSTRTARAIPNRIGTTVNVETPLVRAALVSTAADPHPRMATTRGVHGFMTGGTVPAELGLKDKGEGTDNVTI